MLVCSRPNRDRKRLRGHSLPHHPTYGSRIDDLDSSMAQGRVVPRVEIRAMVARDRHCRRLRQPRWPMSRPAGVPHFAHQQALLAQFPIADRFLLFPKIPTQRAAYPFVDVAQTNQNFRNLGEHHTNQSLPSPRSKSARARVLTSPGVQRWEFDILSLELTCPRTHRFFRRRFAAENRSYSTAAANARILGTCLSSCD